MTRDEANTLLHSIVNRRQASEPFEEHMVMIQTEELGQTWHAIRVPVDYSMAVEQWGLQGDLRMAGLTTARVFV